MKNKKAISKLVVALVLSLAILYVFLWPIIHDIFVGQQIAYLGGQTEEVTKDCDGDNVIGFSDQCPCNANKQKLEQGEKCDNPDPSAENNCPALCK